MKNNMMLLLLALGSFAVWQMSKGTPAAAASRIPEPVLAPPPVLTQPILPAPDPYAKALANAITAGFTAKSSELQAVEDALGRDSAEYKGAIDTAYQEVADNLGPGEVVACSSTRGYYAVSAAEAATWDVH